MTDTTPKKARPEQDEKTPPPLTPSEKREARAGILAASPKRASPVPDANPNAPKSPKNRPATDESLSKVASPQPLAI